MAKQPDKRPLHHDFTFASDADLDLQIAAFQAAHEATAHERLAMDARRSLGPGKVRISFRLVPGKPVRR